MKDFYTVQVKSKDGDFPSLNLGPEISLSFSPFRNKNSQFLFVSI